MKGILNEYFAIVDVTKDQISTGTAILSDGDLQEFDKGDVVEILKVINTKQFIADKAYVIYNPKTIASLVVSSMFVDIVEEDKWIRKGWMQWEIKQVI